MPERLRAMLSHFSLTQAQLAAVVGLEQTQISRWLSGKNAMAQQSAMAFQTALGVRWQWLLNGEGEMLMAKAENLTDEQKIIVDLMSALTHDERMRLIGMAEGMIDLRRFGKGEK